MAKSASKANSRSGAEYSDAAALLQRLASGSENLAAVSKPFARLRMLHLQALAHDFAGQARRAEFAMAQCLEAAKHYYGQRGAAEIDGAVGRDYLVQALAGASVAIARGASGDDPRLNLHLTHAAAFLALGSNENQLGDWVAEQRISRAVAAGRHFDALEIAVDALRSGGETSLFAQRVAEQVQAYTHAALSKEQSQQAALKNAATCDKIIEKVSRPRTDGVVDLGLLDLEAELRRVAAVSNANGGRWADAAAQARMALALNPSAPASRQLLVQLSDQARQLSEKISQAEAQIGHGASGRLTDEAKRLKEETGRALKALNADERLEEATARAARRRAEAETIWRNVVDAPLPDDEGALERAEALVKVLEGQPRGLFGDAQAAAVATALAADPKTAGIDAEKATAFLRKLQGDRFPLQPAPVPPQPPLPEPVVLPPLAAKQADETIAEWWRGPRDRWQKIVAVGSLTALVAFASAFGFNAWHSARRDAAFAVLVSQPAAQDPKAVVSAAKDFFAISVLRPDHGREVAALSAYRQGLIELARAAPEDASLAQAFAAYEAAAKIVSMRWRKADEAASKLGGTWMPIAFGAPAIDFPVPAVAEPAPYPEDVLPPGGAPATSPAPQPEEMPPPLAPSDTAPAPVPARPGDGGGGG